jgi:hypothetical protein
LIAALLCQRNQAQQAGLDHFFGSLADQAAPERVASDRAFARARARLRAHALADLNDRLIERAAAVVPLWRGLRVVAADASVLAPAIRRCHAPRSPAARGDQRLFALYLPGAELTLHASVHGPEVSERQMLFEALDRLGPDDVLVLDRGYPAAWLVALLIKRGIRFVMRCDNASGWLATRRFMAGGTQQQWVELNRPSARDVADFGCPDAAPSVRLVRQTSPSGLVRVLATNLDEGNFPPEVFGDLYHQRWRIEEAFKRIKHRLHLECVSGLSQQALLVDVAAKILADNIAALLCAAASEHANLPARSRKCNRAYAAALMPQVLPRMLLAAVDLARLIHHVIAQLAAVTQRFVPRPSRPRPAHHVKPHPSMAYKR